VSKATVVFGGPSAEHDISILTGLQAERILAKAGYEVQCLYWARSDKWFLVPANGEARDFLGGEPKGSKAVELRLGTGGSGKGDGFYLPGGLGGGKRLEVGAVLNCFHGGAGESGGVQWIFELAGIRATGASPQSAALGMDKLAFGATMLNAGIPSLSRELLSARREPSFAGPYIVKPRFGGSSIGIEIVDGYDSALALLQTSPHLRAGAVVEPYRPDLFDLNVSVRTFPEVVVSDIEKPLRPGDGSIYDYSAKYVHTDGLTAAPREFPAQVPGDLTARIKELAVLVAEQTGLTGILRIDFLSDGQGEVYVNEVNSIPGALALYLWPDTPASQVLSGALAEAERHIPQVTRNYEEGVALRAAGGIASKLHGLQ
jgi:D-alanine-D-alanine ligase